jgi:hypothetical protein
MNEWNLNQKDWLAPRPGKASTRVAYCPACGRPFLRGTGFRQDAPANAGKPPPCPDAEPPPEEAGFPEYCSEKCLPGLLA